MPQSGSWMPRILHTHLPHKELNPRWQASTCWGPAVSSSLPWGQCLHPGLGSSQAFPSFSSHQKMHSSEEKLIKERQGRGCKFSLSGSPPPSHRNKETGPGRLIAILDFYLDYLYDLVNGLFWKSDVLCGWAQHAISSCLGHSSLFVVLMLSPLYFSFSIRIGLICHFLKEVVTVCYFFNTLWDLVL